MLEFFLYESFQQIEQLEETILTSERTGKLEPEQINQMFRVMHTIKGSSAMMNFNDISALSHIAEDLLHFFREHPSAVNDSARVADIVLSVSDAMKEEFQTIERCGASANTFRELKRTVGLYLDEMKQSFLKADAEGAAADDRPREDGGVPIRADPAVAPGMFVYEATMFLSNDAGMENVRCYSVLHALQEQAEIYGYAPEDILTDHEGSSERIRRDGFRIVFAALLSYEEAVEFFAGASHIDKVEVKRLPAFAGHGAAADPPNDGTETESASREAPGRAQNHFISVNVEKMDKLMDLVGELVISEAMVTEHPELKHLPLEQFIKAARQLKKITGEIQDVVMSIRMVPLSATFQKMTRVVRDMNKKLKKEVALHISGQETEVDKSIIELLSDPLMHIIRNSIDHGIEPAAERTEAGKPAQGSVRLEARNAGGEVWITIRDDGRGLDKDRILRKAKAAGLLFKPEEEYADREIYSMIFLPGFSTKDSVSEFSGRGVGMDVANKNIQSLGGTIQVESARGKGTAVLIKIPLTLAIIDGMTVKVGESRFTVPTNSIRESFRAAEGDIIRDPDGREMILIRGQAYEVLRLYRRYNIETGIASLEQGIMLMVEYEGTIMCLFADELLGKQQVVVKALPPILKKIKGISGCTLLGDGSISLILDVSGLMQRIA